MKKYRKLYRMRKVLSMALSILIQIYWYKLLRKSESEWDILWGKIGHRFYHTLIELEGVLIKIGQFLSIRADLLPRSFIDQIKDLVDKVPPSPWQNIKEILETEWGAPLGDKLDSINEEAVASASIGEVYAAYLKNGAKVAVKVQRPNIQSIIQTDFRSLAIIIWFVHYFVPVPKGFINFKVLYQELKYVIERELDFKKEMESLLYFQERFKGMDRLKIPNVYAELSTSKVMVMEWVDGVKITDADALNNEDIDRKELGEYLLNIFLPQWLEPGLFHADPHAGNILLGQNGCIVLLDFGMIGEISAIDAKSFQGLIEGLLAKDYPKVVNYLSQLGFLLPRVDTKLIENILPEMLSINLMNIKKMDILAFKKEMNDIVRSLPIQVPTRFVFLGRSFVTIEGILKTIVPNEDLIELGQPIFIEWLNKEGTSKWKLLWQWLHTQPLFKVVHSITEFLQIPQKLEDLKETEQRRLFQFTMYENQKKHLFQLGNAGILGVLIGNYANDPFIWKVSLGIATIGWLGYVISNYKQKKWMKYMQSNRK